MHIIETPAYRKACIQYLRHGTPLDISLKAMMEDRPTTHYIWRTQGEWEFLPGDRVRCISTQWDKEELINLAIEKIG